MAVVVPGVSNLRELGCGASSVVYEGVQDDFGRSVAVKVVHGRFDRSALDRFRKECLAVGPVSRHPNIITVFGAGATAGGEPFLMMELFTTGSFAALLQARGPLPPEEVLRTGIALCGALETAHLAGIFHRDVKPENILVGAGGEAVLADFGVAVAGAQRGQGDVAFTAAHAAPEVLIDQAEPSPPVDVYSLGSTLYELLAGVPAFPRRGGEARLAHYRRIAVEPVPPLRRSDVPAAAVEAIQATLAKAPEERPTILELAKRLGDAQEALLQQRTEPVVLEVDQTPSPGDEVRDIGDALSPGHSGTEVVERDRTNEALESPPLVAPRSKAPLLIIGGALLVAAVLIGGAVIATAGGGGGSDSTVTTAAAADPAVATSRDGRTVPAPTEAVPQELIPTGVSVAASSAGHLEVSWASPSRGAPVRYTVVYSAPSGKPQTKDVAGTATAVSVDGAAPASCVRVLAIFPSASGRGFTQGQSDRACP